MTLCPVDDAPSDPSFAEYRNRLAAAIEQKSEQALLPLLAQDIRTSFGGGGGIEEFRKHWKTSSPDSPLWDELGEIVSNGGSFKGEATSRMFWAPYVYSNWPDDVDAFEHLAALRAGVELKNRADENADLVRTLDWSIIRILQPGSDSPWRQVRTADGAEGWVRSKDVRSPIDYRAGFSQVKGEWKMTALVAGD